MKRKPRVSSLQAEEEARLLMLAAQRKTQPLSALIAELIEREPSSGTNELEVFITAYNDKEAGAWAYREVGKSTDPVVTEFCRARLNKLDEKKNEQEQRQNLKRFFKPLRD